MNASLNNATAEPAPVITMRGLHLTPGTLDFGDHMDHGIPIRELRCSFQKDFGTAEERDFLVAIMRRCFDGRREFCRCGSDLTGFNVAWRIWELLECADDDVERQRVVEILNSHREDDMPELSLEVVAEPVLIFPGNRKRGYTAEYTSIYIHAGEARSCEHLRRETPKTYADDVVIRTTIYK